MITAGGTKHKRQWGLRYTEARAHALMVAVIMWAGAALVTFGRPGPRNLVDHLKGEDFLQIYTLAHVAFQGPYPTLSESDSFHRHQLELVPASQDYVFLPVYPPSAALIFRPFAALSFGWAALTWALITVLGYAGIVWGAWRPEKLTLADTRFVIAAAAAFPPFFLVVIYGQTTLIPLLAFFLCWLALRSNRPVTAGLALGLLSIKPQFALGVGAVLAFSLSWRILLGFTLSFLAQMLLVTWAIGFAAFEAYGRTVLGMPTVEHLLEPDAWRMHSLRALTRLLPSPAGELVWLVASVLLIRLAVKVWRSSAPLGPRFGLVILATTLINPHLFGYDAVVLVLPFIWLGAWVEEKRPSIRHAYWQSLYFLSVLLLFPSALLLHLQLSVVLMVWLFWEVSRELLASDYGSVGISGRQM
jgi:hypothetical protein